MCLRLNRVPRILSAFVSETEYLTKAHAMALRTAILCHLLLSCHALIRGEDGPSSEGITFFETHVRPVLVAHCYECHSREAEKVGGRLLLDSRDGMRKGGESGPALVPGKPDESLLLHALRWEHDLEMPPDEPLPEATISRLAEWIAQGAPDPRARNPGPAVPDSSAGLATLWSLAPIRRPAAPPPSSQSPHADWPRGEIDRFVLSRMEGEGLAPTSDASPETLVRRLHFDLIGLPPTLDRLQRFVADFDRHPEPAVADLVEELLASPHFGERWGRHWLDVARYAESNGNDGLSRNPTFPHAWRYRDYVIDALNTDVPYDRFLAEQIAGDLLPSATPEDRDRLLVATGYLALSAKPAKAMNNNFAMDVVADQLDLIGRGVLGLGIGCARCHDHKFDPIPLRDYYALAGIFTSTETMWGLAGNEKLTAPPTDLHVLSTVPGVAPPPDFVESVVLRESATGQPKKSPPSPWKPGTPLAMGARDAKEPADCRINLKGDAKKLGDSVPRGFLSAVSLDGTIAIAPETSGRRELAAWLASPDHPLTARVFVNRAWGHLFARGLVATPDDFGHYGSRPTHPDLLDHLASRFIDDGWSIKSVVRSIVLSRTYRLASTTDAAAASRDPANLWLSRQARRRLDAESLRDAMLQVSGQLDRNPGEGSPVRHRDILVNLAGTSLHQPSPHRSIYLCYLRDSPPPELVAFDLPDFRTVTGRRDVSVRPDQALWLFNNPFVVEQSRHLARSLGSSTGHESITRLYRRILLRNPEPDELVRAAHLLSSTGKETGSLTEAWASLAQALLISNEFRYLD